MSYPIPMTKSKKNPVRFSTYSSSLEYSVPGDYQKDKSSTSETINQPTSPQTSTSTTPTLENRNSCDKLVELIQSVLQCNTSSSNEENQVNSSSRSDLHIYVRRKGDFQVRKIYY